MPAIYLLRHGQASFGGPDYDVLSTTGERQAKILGEELRRRAPRIHSVHSGTLRRQLETAAACLPAIGIENEVHQDARWDEYDHVGLLATPQPLSSSTTTVLQDFQDQLDAALTNWIAGTAKAGTSGTWKEFSTRTTEAVSDLATSLPKGESALVFTSAGVIAALCTTFLGLPPQGYLALNRTMANCGISKLVTGRSGTNLVSLNEHAHFEGNNREILTYR